MNYYAKKLMAKYFRNFQVSVVQFGNVTKCSVFKLLGINILETIFEILRVYINIAAIDPILEEIVNDERSYEDGLLIDLGKTAFKHKLLSDSNAKKLQDLISRLRVLASSAENYKALLDDFPEEFMC